MTCSVSQLGVVEMGFVSLHRLSLPNTLGYVSDNSAEVFLIAEVNGYVGLGGLEHSQCSLPQA